MIRRLLRGAVMEPANNPIASRETPTHGSIPATVTSVPTDETLSLVAVVADAVPITNLPLRARLLQLLMIPIGPLAMTVLAGGVRASIAHPAIVGRRRTSHVGPGGRDRALSRAKRSIGAGAGRGRAFARSHRDGGARHVGRGDCCQARLRKPVPRHECAMSQVRVKSVALAG
jgi:hypothetical protein